MLQWLKKLKYLYTDPLYRNSLALMLNSAFMAFFGLLFWIVAARTMPAKDIGLATAAISAAALIVGLSKMGLDAGLVRYLPESKNKNGLYSTIVMVTLVLALVLTAVFMLGINIFSPALSFLRDGWFLPVFIAYIAVTSIYFVQNMAFISIRRADLSLFQNLLLGVRIPILLLVAGMGVFGVFSSLGIACLMTFVFGAFLLRRYGLFLSKGFDIASIRKILKFSLGNYTAGIFAMAPTTIIPVMILNTIGAEESAYFYVAYSVAGLLSMIPAAVSMSLFVEGSHSLPLKESTIKSLRLITLLMVPALIFIYLFGDKLLLLFSREYSVQSFEMLQLLAVSSIFSAVTSIYLSIKMIQRDVRMINYVNFALSVLIIGLGYISLLKYGLLGLGYAWLGANVMVCMVVAVMVSRERWGLRVNYG
jgi:O-antigen/teichoic acid export membrane protein